MTRFASFLCRSSGYISMVGRAEALQDALGVAPEQIWPSRYLSPR
ncbi:TPA: hypothetical protein ACNUZL_003096 [Citrobacter farmeri]